MHRRCFHQGISQGLHLTYTSRAHKEESGGPCSTRRGARNRAGPGAWNHLPLIPRQLPPSAEKPAVLGFQAMERTPIPSPIPAYSRRV